MACGIAAALAGSGAVEASAQSPGCGLDPTGGTVIRTLGDRSYLVNVPPGLTAPAPLLLSVHGFGGWAAQQEQGTGWTPFAAAHHFIVAYPQGRLSSFSSAWDPYTPRSVDVGFLRDVVSDISSRWCVEPKRIHVDGWSNGAVMSQRMACAAADLFASATSYAGGTPTAGGLGAPCAPARPISVMLLAGQWDFTYAGLASNAAEWRTLDGCSGAATHTSDTYGSTDTYGCAAGTRVVARVVANTSHNWPFGGQAEDQRERMWAFFAANPRP